MFAGHYSRLIYIYFYYKIPVQKFIFPIVFFLVNSHGLHSENRIENNVTIIIHDKTRNKTRHELSMLNHHLVKRKGNNPENPTRIIEAIVPTDAAFLR